MLLCPACQTNGAKSELDVHRTGDAMITYCERCGSTTVTKRTVPREKWDEKTREEYQARIALPKKKRGPR